MNMLERSGDGTLVDRFRGVLSEWADRPLYRFLQDERDEFDVLTGQELDRRARAIAVALAQRVPVGERAMILCPPGLDYVASFFGCLYAGVVAVPAYPPNPGVLARMLPRLTGVIEDAAPAVVLAPAAMTGMGTEMAALAPAMRELPWLAVDAVDADRAQDWRRPDIGPDSLAFLQYTSGSTGRPKGVMLRHSNLLANLAAIQEWMFEPDEPNPHVVSWLPPYHDMGLIGGLLEAAYQGCPVTFMSPLSFLKRPGRWLRTISETRATHSGAPNFAYDVCVAKIPESERVELDLSTWRVAFSGAEPVRSQTLDAFAQAFAPSGFRPESFYPCYGMAEASLLLSGGSPATAPQRLEVDGEALQNNRFRAPARQASVRTLVSCGKPIAGHRLAVVSPQTRESLPEGAVGEIWVSGPSIAQGFWRRPADTDERLQARLADGSGPFLRTGDLGFLRDGEVYVTGRIKDLIIVGGKNHYPHDIERTVETAHPALRPGAGIAFSVDDGQTERLVVVQAANVGAARQRSEEIFAAIRSAVSAEHGLQVHDVVLVKTGSIPKTSSGKLQRFACRRSFLAGELDPVAQWSLSPRGAETGERDEAGELDGASEPSRPGLTELERRIVQELATRLRVTPASIDIHAPLAGLGLQSMDQVILVGELERLVGRSLPATLTWEFPTIQALAAHLARPQTQPAHTPPSTAGRPTAEKPATAEPIAVIGIGCRFPGGADSPAAFWQLLDQGRDAVTEVPPQRWQIADFFGDDPEAAGRTNSRWGGFLEEVDLFDPEFFGVSHREAAGMDPQQRLLAEVAWEALEDAGIVPASLAGTPTGVFVGISTSDYAQAQFADLERIDAHTGTGSAHSIAANRLSYLFDLRGPSLAVDTACSSSLVAVQQACTAIAQGDCSTALVGGVNLVLSPALAINFSKAGAMAADGRCKAFDSRADGYVRSEGAGMVVLKPLSRALADQDSVYAVIRGYAVNQDGRTNGLMAPSPQAQEAVLRRAYQRAGVDPGQVHHVEAHGTGTLLGDPIEAKALGAVLGTARERTRPLLIGSVKSNLGHLEAAAGIAGLIKTALMLRHRRIPASLHFRQGNPHIPFAQLGLQVAADAQAWPAGDGPALASVSSFGFGGTNAHVVLEEAPPRCAAEHPATAVSPHVLTLSAATGAGLRELADQHAAALRQPGTDLATYVASAALRRSHHAHRLAAVGDTAEQLTSALTAFVTGTPAEDVVTGHRGPGSRPRTVFVFSGQGPRWWPLSSGLLGAEPVFRQGLEHCDAVLREHVEWSLMDQLTMPADRARLADPGVAQPATTALQIALAALWRSWGIEPGAVVGHSLGEVAAAQVSGALSIEDALRVALERGRVIRPVIGKGKMAVIGEPLGQTERLLARLAVGQISVAASNGPASTVVSGETVAVERLAARLDAEGTFCRVLESVDFASHSPQMEPLQQGLREALSGVRARAAEVVMISTVTGEPIDGQMLDAGYWAQNLRQPVLFDRAVQTLRTGGHDTFVEISGHPMLTGAIAEKLDGSDGPAGIVVSSLHRERPPLRALFTELAWLYAHGSEVDWAGFHRGHGVGAPVLDLPTYPWQRVRCWLDDSEPGTPLFRPAGARRAPEPDQWRYQVGWKALTTPAPVQPEGGRWLVLVPEGRTDDPLLRTVGTAVAVRGASPVHVEVPAGADRDDLVKKLRAALSPEGHTRGVISLLALDQSPDPEHPALPRGTAQTLALAQALGEFAETAGPLWLLTRDAVSTDADERLGSPWQALVWGLGRVVGLEHPERWGGLIDVGEAGPQTAGLLATALGGPSEEDQIAVRSGGLLVRRLLSVASATTKDVGAGYRFTGTVLVTGGTGELGRELARRLAREGAQHLVLVSRRGPDAEGAGPLQAELAALGARVTLAACDVADRTALAGLIEGLRQRGTPVRALFHAAGDVSLVKGLDDTSRAELAQVVAAKDAGALNLHELLPDDLDAFVLYSSITGVWGSGRQCAYSAANAFLDALAEHRRGQGLRAVSVQWGPWAGPAHDEHQHELERRGLRLMDPGRALDRLAEVLTHDEATTVVADLDWSLFAPAYAAARTRPFLHDLPAARRAVQQASGPAAEEDGPDLRRRLLALPPGDARRDLLSRHCREQIALVLRTDPARIDVRAPLAALGFDSLLSLELRKRLEKTVGSALPATLAWRHPTVEALVPFLAERMGIELQPAAPPSSPPEPVVDVGTLSDSDAEALLLARLEDIEAGRSGHPGHAMNVATDEGASR